MFPCHRPIGFLLLEGGGGILNVCKYLNCAVHAKTSLALMSAQMLEEVKIFPFPCHSPESNPGHWTGPNVLAS